jgi:transposase
MGLKDKLRRIRRMAEREMITFQLQDGTTARLYSEEFMECFVHESARGRRHYFWEEPGPAHPIIEALRNVSDEELSRVFSENGMLLQHLFAEDQIIRGERERKRHEDAQRKLRTIDAEK